MADSMDLVQQCVEEERQRHIQKALTSKHAVSSFYCESCGAPIPEARRAAVLGVELCVTCREIAELKGKHYNGRAV